MNSPEQFAVHPLDCLIRETLQAQVGDAEPSPRSWRRLRAQAAHLAAAKRGNHPRRWTLGESSRVDAHGWVAGWVFARGLVAFPARIG
ncbi:MAG: hypothetical protein JW900_10470 [Anaerolineae bacterium]|nr:hypothetical protein [Anaerolineae bacterium]